MAGRIIENIKNGLKINHTSVFYSFREFEDSKDLNIRMTGDAHDEDGMLRILMKTGKYTNGIEFDHNRPQIEIR